jgi:hypothetical protein
MCFLYPEIPKYTTVPATGVIHNRTLLNTLLYLNPTYFGQIKPFNTTHIDIY